MTSSLTEFKTGPLNEVLSMCMGASTIPDGIGQTALFYAVQRPMDPEAVQVADRLITDAGIDPLRKDFGGQSPLFYAVAAGNFETVKLLITNHHCPPNEADNLLQTPLFYAARDGRTNMVEFLIQAGANPCHIDRNGQTPLFYAARENRKAVVDILVSHGALADHVDAAGRRASYFAKLANHNDLAQHLQSLEEQASSNPNGRKRYRLVFVNASGVQQTPTLEQLEWIEKEYPDICVWSKTGPIATTVALPISVTTNETVAARSRQSVTLKKKAPAPAPVPVWVTVGRQMVSEIFKKEDAWIFLRPVDPLRDMCPDYLTMIKEPMDFSTIRKKMSKYSNKAEFLHDCDLVFSNCKTYNKPGTLPEVLGSRVELFWKDLVDRYSFHQLPDSTLESALSPSQQ